MENDPRDTPPADARPSRMTREQFVALYGDVYEHSAWIAEAAHDAGLDTGADTPEGLHAAMARVLENAPRERKLALIRAHPDLAGRLAVAEMAPESQSEQASAGLTQLTKEERDCFLALNDAYKAKFDFPFIMAVRGRGKAEIMRAFEERLDNDPEREFETAMEQISRIALLRLRERMGG
ncbi:MAG: 2-oxo-4-hydroxy-4-carboxy-5-ureidoimidazoline decarboxylase [Salinarimonadaceae bacterium]|nr:MAG: 2-oxo-4-hydroxy-4-carboxy-5-ureidoimidazoline decarboxylase [Salinarimonadaceae bacterium]